MKAVPARRKHSLVGVAAVTCALLACRQNPRTEAADASTPQTVSTIVVKPRIVLGDDARHDPPLYRISGASILADGRIAIANDGSKEILIYDQHGRLERRLGGAGEGPAEFGAITSLFPMHGDSLLAAYDGARRRVSFWTPEGLKSAVQLPESFDGRPQLVGMVDDHTAAIVIDDPPKRAAPDGLVPYSARIMIFDTITKTAAVLGTQRALDHFASKRGTRTLSMVMPFGTVLRGVTIDSNVVTLSSPADELTIYRRDGSKTSAKIALTHAPLSDAVFDTTIRSIVSEMPDAMRERWAETLNNMPRPATVPGFSQLVADERGCLWVGAWSMNRAETREWSVFGMNGEEVATTRLPVPLHIYQITNTMMVGSALDDDGTEHVHLVDLENPPRCQG